MARIDDNHESPTRWWVVLGLLIAATLWPVIGFPQFTPHRSLDSSGKAGGSPSELELSTFGRYLDADHLGDISVTGLKRVMFETILALYKLSAQSGQVLRLCQVQETIAKNEQERALARDCRLSSLLKLGRFVEAEELFISDDRGSSRTEVNDQNLELNRWQYIGAFALHQGEIALGVEAHQKVLKLVDSLKQQQSQASESRGTSVVSDSLQELSEFSLQVTRIASLERLARVAYFRQDPSEYLRRVKDLLGDAAASDLSNTQGLLAIDLAWPLSRMGDREFAIELARHAHAAVKADAGFRDHKEPLETFTIPDAVSATIGSERTSRMHVNSRLRLARVYILLGRTDEATRLLANTQTLAGRYILEEAVSSTLIAEVEETQADLMSQMNRHADSLQLLRSARLRRQLAAQSERSSSVGRRRLEFDSPLLAVDARLLAEIAASTPMPIRKPALANEILAILSDFSASRADRSARQAARAATAPNEEQKSLLQREGLLVDQLMDLRASLSARVSASGEFPSSQIADIQARLAELLAEIRTVKAKLATVTKTTVIGSSGKLSKDLLLSLKPDEVFWQWIIHPEGNLIVAVTRDGVHIKPIGAKAQEISSWAKAVHESASLQGVATVAQLKKYSIESAAALFRALFPNLTSKGIGGQHWILSVPQLMDGIPWGALVTGTGSGNSQGVRWLIEDVALTLVPSAETWVGLHKRSPSQASLAFLGIGDPANEGLVSNTEINVRGSLVAAIAPAGTLAPITNSAFSVELHEVGQLFPPTSRTVLAGPKATKKQLQALQLSDYRVLLFSTHGHLADAVYVAMGPALELTAPRDQPRDRYLSSSEVAAMHLDADVVLLSACDTSASDGSRDAEGFSGLTSAFLLAGTRSVVATLWPVETTTTSRFIQVAMRAYKTHPHRPFSFSLQEAALSVMRNSGSEWHHPAFWSPFVVVGR